MDYDYIECGDCVQLMKSLPDECIDITVTSPPYDDLRTYTGYTLAAFKTNRHYIGFEISEKYFDIACKRLGEAEMNAKSPKH